MPCPRKSNLIATESLKVFKKKKIKKNPDIRF